jgi:hypothetical protein
MDVAAPTRFCWTPNDPHIFERSWSPRPATWSGPECYQAIVFRDGAPSRNIFLGALIMFRPVQSGLGCRECVGRTSGAPSQTQAPYSPRSQGTPGTPNLIPITTVIYRFTTQRNRQSFS